MTDREMATDPAAENAVDAFIDLFNARDLEGIGELLFAEVTSEIFEGASRDEVLGGMGDFVLRFPTLILTRGELGVEPVAAAWVVEDQSYRPVGYFSFAFEDGQSGEALIEHIQYVETGDSELDEILFEEPDPDEIAEWEDWAAWDES